MKVVDILLLRRKRLTPLEQVIAILVATGLVMLMAGIIQTLTHHDPQRRHTPTDGVEYPVQPPGFIASAHTPTVLPADTKAEVATLVRYYLGPSGKSFNCVGKWYYLVPYQRCTIMFQPATTRAIATWLKAQQGANAVLAVSLIVGTAIAVCSQMGLEAVSYVCGAFAVWYGNQLVTRIKEAANYQQCFRMDWNYLPSVNAFLSISNRQPPVSFSAGRYGEWQRWVIKSQYHNGQWDNYWVFGYPTSCIMPRDCTDIPTPIGAGCIV